MLKFFLIAAIALVSANGIYDFSVSSADGQTINFSDFKGKKILIVNTASGSKYVSQYGSLEQLYQKYKDSLVIIAIPSNSFGNEPLTDNSSIENFVQGTYHIHYLLTGLINVNGTGQHALYQWLTNVSQNGTMNVGMKGDFQKYLIGSNGTLIGFFHPAIDPMNSLIQNAITGSN